MKTNRRDFLKGFGVLVAGLLLPNGKEKEVATESVIYDVIVEPVEIEAGVGGVQFVRDDACCSCVLVGMKKAECCGMRNYVRDFDNSIDVVGTIKARLEWTRIVQENNDALDKIRQARQFMESRASACGVKIEVAKDGEQCDGEDPGDDEALYCANWHRIILPAQSRDAYCAELKMMRDEAFACNSWKEKEEEEQEGNDGPFLVGEINSVPTVIYQPLGHMPTVVKYPWLSSDAAQEIVDTLNRLWKLK